jgi:hypothetical protein
VAGQVTLADVARAAGVSLATASRAVNGSPDRTVREGLRERVFQAAAELNYSTNSGARNLRRARAGSIGLWLPQGLVLMEYYMNFTFGVVEATNDQELTVSLIPGDYPPEKAGALHVDGRALAPGIRGYLVQDAPAQLQIVFDSKLRLGQTPRKRGDKICPADNAYELAVPEHRQPLEALLLHQVDNLVRRRLGIDADNVPRHDVLDLASVRPRIFLRQVARLEP